MLSAERTRSTAWKLDVSDTAARDRGARPTVRLSPTPSRSGDGAPTNGRLPFSECINETDHNQGTIYHNLLQRGMIPRGNAFPRGK